MSAWILELFSHTARNKAMSACSHMRFFLSDWLYIPTVVCVHSSSLCVGMGTMPVTTKAKKIDLLFLRHFFEKTNASGAKIIFFTSDYLKTKVNLTKIWAKFFWYKFFKRGWKNECPGAWETEDQIFSA